MRENCRVGCEQKVVLDKGSLHRDPPVTKALKFPSCTRKSFSPSELEWTVREGVYTERNDDRYGGRIT